jgi:hypothetical protein
LWWWAGVWSVPAWCLRRYGLQKRASVLALVGVCYPNGGVYYPLALCIGLMFVLQSIDASSVSPSRRSPSRGWVLLVLSPTRVRVNTSVIGAPGYACCAQSCVKPLFIGSPGRSFPWGLVAVPVRLRAAFSPIPSNAVVFTRGTAGGRADAPSNHRVRFRVVVIFTCKVF